MNRESNPGGLLAAAALSSPLEKMNGQSRPALSFPDPHTHVTDVRFSTENDGLSLTVDFGTK